MPELKGYLDLVVRMYELSPEGLVHSCACMCLFLLNPPWQCCKYSWFGVGEHSIKFLSDVFEKLDAESEYNLSKRKTKKDRHRWYVDEAELL